MTPLESFEDLIEAYHAEDRERDPATKPAGAEPSWNYCYGWFNHDRSAPYDLRRDCLELGYYLANWGMFRGSGVLMTTNLAAWRPTIDVITAHHEAMRRVDLAGADDEWFDLERVYRELGRAIPGTPTATLVTKVMLGVWGCVPAMDTYALAGIRRHRERDGQRGIGTFNRRLYDYLSEVRSDHRDLIDRLRDSALSTFDNSTWKTQIPAGKVLDMYFFQLGRAELTKQAHV